MKSSPTLESHLYVLSTNKQCGLKFPRINFEKLLFPKASENSDGWIIAQKRVSVQPLAIYQLIKSLICIAALG